jgi:threonine aldolase
LQSGLESKGFSMLIHSPSNQIFPIVPDALIPTLKELCTFEIWEKRDEAHTVIRFVTSFATTEQEVDALLAAL